MCCIFIIVIIKSNSFYKSLDKHDSVEHFNHNLFFFIFNFAVTTIAPTTGKYSNLVLTKWKSASNLSKIQSNKKENQILDWVEKKITDLLQLSLRWIFSGTLLNGFD